MTSLTTTPTSLIPTATAYAAGSYTLTGLTIGKSYKWVKGANDTNCIVNGSITLTATGVFTATATSVTLTGSGTSTITAVVAQIISVLFASTFTPGQIVKQVTVGEFPVNPNFSRQHQISNEAHFVKRGTAGFAIKLADFTNLGIDLAIGLTWTPPIILTQPASVSVAHTVQTSLVIVPASEFDLTYAWFELTPISKTVGTTISFSSTKLVYASGAATATITSNNTTPSDGDTVKIGEKIYTFKTTLTPTEGEVLINGSADAALLNLIRAINHSGTPDTDYKCAAAHPAVSAATSVTSHAFAITAKALTTTGIYDVATAGTLKITPTDTSLTGTAYYCTVTDDAGSFGLTNGSVTSDGTAVLTVT